MAPVAMLVADAEGRLVAANSVWLDFAGSAEVTTRPDTWTGLFEPDSRRRMEEYLADVAAGRPAPATIDAEMLTRSGRHWTRWWARRESLEGSVLVTLVVVDVHDEVNRTQDLRQLATHDHMTGLLNRRFFMEAVAQSQRRVARSGRLLALLYIDLDHFKTVNDHAGHAVGDQVLAMVATRLQTAIRGADLAARLGGDEFAILLEDVAGPSYADAVAARVTHSLADPIEVGGQPWPVAACIGVAMLGDPDESADGWLHRADQAMYAAKRRRRGAGQSLMAEARSAYAAGLAPAGTPPESQPVPSVPSVPSGFSGSSAWSEPVPAGGGDSPDPRPDEPTLDRLRVLRDDLARVRRSLEEFDERLRA